MKVILANPLYDSALTSDRGFQLGLLYISTYLEANGIDCTVIAGEKIASRVIDMLGESESEYLVGFYVSADNIFEVERCCNFVRKACPNVNIILGGPQARVSYRVFLENNLCDFVCIGDGEDCTLQLVRWLEQDDREVKDLENVIALAYIDDGTIKLSRRLYSTLNLDKFPIPKREHYQPNFANFSHICTSRGCASKCTFCYEGTINKLKRHSVDRIIEEMKYLSVEFGTKYFTFIDDTFTSDRKKVLNLSARLDKEFTPGKDLLWYCECKPSDLVKWPDLVPAMVPSGLARAQLGSESGVQDILDAYKKEMRVEDTQVAVSQLYNEGITSIFTNFIIGGALETFETFEKTCCFMVDLLKSAPGVLECSYSFLSPYTGTDIELRPEHYGVDIVDPSFITGSSDSYVFVQPTGMNKDQVKGLGKVFREAITSTMEQIYSELPVDIIRKHIKASRFGLRTNWVDQILQDPIQRNWARYTNQGYDDYLDIKNNEVEYGIPMRTFRMDVIIDNVLILPRRKRKIRLNNLSFRALELASGKIDLHTIAQILDSEFTLGANKEKQTAEVLNKFSAENLIVFRKYF